MKHVGPVLEVIEPFVPGSVSKAWKPAREGREEKFQIKSVSRSRAGLTPKDLGPWARSWSVRQLNRYMSGRGMK